MLMWQAAGSTLKAQGMTPERVRRRAGAVPGRAPAGGQHVNSMVAGINLAVFKNTKNQDGGAEVRQVHDERRRAEVLNKTYGSLPTVNGGA